MPDENLTESEQPKAQHDTPPPPRVDKLRGAVEFIGRHPFATGLLSILGIVGFGLSVIGFGFDRSESMSTTSQIESVESKISDVARGLAEPWQDHPSFKGSWSANAAFIVAWPDADSHQKIIENLHPISVTPDVLNPKLERDFFVPLRNEDVRILITSVSEGSCNACAVQLSLFLFRKSSDHWYLDDEAINFARIGRQGEMNFGEGLRQLDVWRVGDERFGFVIPTNGWYQGDVSEGYEVYSFIAGEMNKVFDGFTRSYFGGIEKAEAIQLGMWFDDHFEIAFDRQSSSFGFYDVLGTFSAHEDSRATKVRIRFDGTRYPFEQIFDLAECVRRLDHPADISATDC